jgi:two-component system OmpR family sensor kinase
MRWTILGSIMVPVLILLAVMGTAITTLVLAESAAEVDDHLAREARELSLLAERATDPDTGQALTDPRELLELYITRTIPDPNETMFVIEDGLVFARTTDTPPVRLDQDLNFLASVNSANTVEFGDWETEVGNARFVVVPVTSGSKSGALVTVIFSDLESAPIRELLIRFGLIALFSLSAMAAIGYLAANRIFRPIQGLTEFASELEGDALSRRIQVGEVRNELDQLATEFNTMLDRLEEAFKSQREFVDVAGHELRTPLTIIRGHFDLMKSDPSETANAMPVIQEELDRMARLVSDLQTLTKSSAPEFLRPDTQEIETFANDLKSKLKTLTKRKIQLVSSAGKWRFDDQRLSQAVLQLVENAAKYTPTRSNINISIGVIGSNLEISVDDSGPGIDDDLKSQVWEPFIRGKGNQNVEGSGLGLSLVRAIAMAHGGEAVVSDSSLGGARFTLRIPRK